MAKKCGRIRQFFGLCGNRRSLGGYDYQASDFRKGDDVSISHIMYFGRHGVVEKTPGKRAKYVPVRVNLLNRVVKFLPGHLRQV